MFDTAICMDTQVLQKQLEYADAPLRMEPKLDYIARKKEDRKDELLVEVGAQAYLLHAEQHMP